LQHRLRLNGAEYARVEPAEVAGESAAVQALWRSVVAPASGPAQPGAA
jgi:hypothetical protein